MSKWSSIYLYAIPANYQSVETMYNIVSDLAVNLEEEGRTVDHAATPGQAQAMLKANAKDREKEHVELMELER